RCILDDERRARSQGREILPGFLVDRIGVRIGRGWQIDLRARDVKKTERVAGGDLPRFVGADDVVRDRRDGRRPFRRRTQGAEGVDGSHPVILLCLFHPVLSWRSRMVGSIAAGRLARGDCSVRSLRSVFKPVEEKDVKLTGGQTLTLRIELTVSSIAEAVTVSGQSPVIETSRSQVSSTVGETAVANLPVNGRNFIDFAL